MKIGIIGAMKVEVDGIKAQMNDVRAAPCHHLTVFEGTLHGVPVALVQCGVGKVHAAITAQILIDTFQVTHIINSGIAGGLDARLSVMDMVVSTDALYHDFDTVPFGYPAGQVPGVDVLAFPADPALVQAVTTAYQNGIAEGALRHHLLSGRVASGDQFINDAAVKARIVAAFSPACCEMEGAAIAHVCYINKVPFVIIRCISDMAENTEEVYREEDAAKESAYVTCRTIKELEVLK